MYNPWQGYNEGLAAFRGALDDAEQMRIRKMEEGRLMRAEERQAAQDALNTPYLQTRNALAEETLEETRRKNATLRDYDVANRAMESGFETARVSDTETAPNPEYVPSKTVTPIAGIRARRRELESGSYADDMIPSEISRQSLGMLPTAQTEAQGLPTVDRQIQRPLTELEKNQRRLGMALKYGQYEDVARIGNVIDITNKMDRQHATDLQAWAGEVMNIRDQFGPEAAKNVAGRLAKEYGVSPQEVGMIDFTATGEIFKVLSNGVGFIIDRKGGVHVVQPNTAENAHNTIDEFSANGTMVRKLQYNPASKRYDIPATGWSKVQKTVPGVSINMNQMSEEEQAALNRALAERRLDPGKVNSRTAKIYAQMELRTPGMNFAANSADIQADTKSLANQMKVRDMMGSFVRNMDTQATRLADIVKDVQRYDTRLLNVPLVKWRTMVAGSPNESKVAMYVTEISNEIGKLATGSSASVAELSEGAQRKWDKIHDKNLSMKDLMSLIEEVRHAGKIRMDSADAQIAETQGRMGKKEAGAAAGGGKKLSADEIADKIKRGEL